MVKVIVEWLYQSRDKHHPFGAFAVVMATDFSDPFKKQILWNLLF
jgi:hypothetical protein